MLALGKIGGAVKIYKKRLHVITLFVQPMLQPKIESVFRMLALLKCS